MTVSTQRGNASEVLILGFPLGTHLNVLKQDSSDKLFDAERKEWILYHQDFPGLWVGHQVSIQRGPVSKAIRPSTSHTHSNQIDLSARFRRSSLISHCTGSLSHLSKLQRPRSLEPFSSNELLGALVQTRGLASPLKPAFHTLEPRSSTTRSSVPYSECLDRSVVA